MTIDQLAEQLYTRRIAERGPAWHQLGEATKGVWRRMVLEEMYG